ncbi:MAG TPA: hypothetical protein VLE97_07410 [Gaiellaceae bacterium]|nr:hypothetical protein [Gaiellaceae bacterium]
MTDLDLYINFVIHAILGRLGEADQIMRIGGPAVRRVAAAIAEECAVPRAPLYRGLLLDPALPFTSDPKLRFLSWSEDRDVALWFSCPRSAVSEPLAQLKPELVGHIASLPGPAAQVLFHHGWASALGGLACFALIHPLMGPAGKEQIEWSLRTQREVITDPVADLSPERVPDLDSDALEALERRLSPPWVIETEGIRR